MIRRTTKPVLLAVLVVAVLAPATAWAAAPTVTLSSPGNDTATSITSPVFSGTADTTAGNLQVTVTIATDAGMSNLVRTLTTSASPGTGAFSVQANGPLLPGIYFAQASQTNTTGQTGMSAVNEFTIQSAPSASTQSADTITFASAQLNGIVNPDSGETTVHFDYGTWPGYGSATSPQDAGAGAQPLLQTASLSGLAPATTYHFRVVAVNALGTTYGSDQTFTTAPAATPTASFIPDSGTLLVASAIAFDGTPSSDPDAAITAYRWDFGDGSTGSGAHWTHTYTRPGTYTVSLTVTDGLGKSSTATDQLSVIAPPPIQTLIETVIPAPVAVRSGRPLVSGGGLVDLGQRLFCPGAGPSCQTTVTSKGAGLAYTTRLTVGANGSFELVLLLSKKGLKALRAHKRLVLKTTIVSTRGAEQTFETVSVGLRPPART